MMRSNLTGLTIFCTNPHVYRLGKQALLPQEVSLRDPQSQLLLLQDSFLDATCCKYLFQRFPLRALLSSHAVLS